MRRMRALHPRAIVARSSSVWLADWQHFLAPLGTPSFNKNTSWNSHQWFALIRTFPGTPIALSWIHQKYLLKCSYSWIRKNSKNWISSAKLDQPNKYGYSWSWRHVATKFPLMLPHRYLQYKGSLFVFGAHDNTLSHTPFLPLSCPWLNMDIDDPVPVPRPGPVYNFFNDHFHFLFLFPLQFVH